MLNLLKWDLGNFIKTYDWLYTGFAICFVIALLPDSVPFFSLVTNGLAAVYSVFFFGYTIVISAGYTISWLRNDSFQLELSLPVTPWKMLLSKLILATLINISGMVLSMVLWLMIDKFGMSNITLFRGFAGFLQYLLSMLTLLVIFMFSYMMAKSFRFTRKKAGIATMIIFFTICSLVAACFLATGAWNITVGAGATFNILMNEKLRWLANLSAIIGPVVVLAAGFSGSCVLFRQKFERYES